MLNNYYQKFREYFRHFRTRSFFFVLAALFITVCIATYVGFEIRALTKESLLLQGELNTKEATIEYTRYLLTRKDIVAMVANYVEDLVESGADSSTIEAYLMVETDNIISSFDPETTGLYGWINGGYVDGAGWVPDADYVPTERPWYVQALASDKEITLVDPYLDVQTNTLMMTVAKLLSDGKSVLALDVSLSPIQAIVKEVSATTEGGRAFLLDGKGVVVAHSDESQLGRNYLEEPDSPGGIAAHRILVDGQMQFETDMPEGAYSVYVDRLEGNWYSVSMINRNVWHHQLHRVMITFSAVLAIVLLSIIAVFLRITAKNAILKELYMKVDREEKRGEELQALSETDRMTGLNDRISGERKVNEQLSSGNVGMFLEFDIDHFKAINDTYGHQAGDFVILAIAEAVRSTFRANDVAMRLGGDEFGVFAVGIASQEMGSAIVQRLFDRMDGINIPELRGESISISIGAVLCSEEKQHTFHELYALADEALYISKKTPGNCLTFSKN